jgi:hypothetical protein
MYPFLNNSSSYICNSFNSIVPILYDVLDTGGALGTKSIEKSMHVFGGNPGITTKTSLKSFKIGWYSMLGIVSLAASSIWDEKI